MVNLIKIIGFIPKENTAGIFSKVYSNHNNYEILVDFSKEKINYGSLIKSDNSSTQNFSQPENWVVFECVNRLLEKGYKPENIVLEKTWGAGHGSSGRLDICVTREDGSEYLLIECKTYGKEFEKEFTRMKKDGGQLFTYFKFSNKADLVMLYASELKGNEPTVRNEIVKIEDDYRLGDVKDFYEKWNKLTKDNGVFDSWVKPYNFESKALTIKDLEEIKQDDSSFIFNRFLEILRHNVVSDKGNAFNRIFTLFLCKIYDEKVNEGTDNELGFQWLEGIDDHRSFQIRLTDLYKNGMHEFLEKVVTDFSETEFNNKFKHLEENLRNDILAQFHKIRLEKNNEFAIKDVYDEQSFNENAVVVKEIVELLQGFKLRYTKKQQYLSDFFELLLTTGLKQESGQFFTPVPVAQFVIKSLPIDTILEEKLSGAKIDNDTLLPYVMDYAAGSGHFVTETMHEIQRLIKNKIDKNYHPSVAKKIRNWQDDHFAWAIQYIYGIEKDYRLVKVGKVGCYLHGDGLANVIHSDGLANFSHPDYKGKLLIRDKDFPQENKQFDIITSNPPYSVSAFKNSARPFYKENDFELYNRLTDNSSEIECLFIERTKQLLKDGGVAGIILPSSILSNTGIYTKSREIILQYFDIVGIAELGSNTFMATGTNTVTLFLRRKNNYISINTRKAVEIFFNTQLDVTINGIEKPVDKYLNHVWEGVGFDDYLSLIRKQPNEKVVQHEIYTEYQKKLKAKNEAEFWKMVLEKEAEKLLYFVLAYPQKVILIKSGEKDAEKRFLGYEFSNRRGSEGIHAIQRDKNIEECTQMFDPEVFDNPTKASTYIYKAFGGDYDFPIDETMQNNVSRHHLIDMLTFDRVEFEKNISLSVKKKVKIESKWTKFELKSICTINPSKSEIQKFSDSIYVSFIEMASVSNYGKIETKIDRKLGELKKGSYKFFKNSDILIAKITPCMENGKCAIAENLTNGIGMGSSEFHVLRTHENLLPNYVFELLNRKEIREVAESQMTGASGHRRVPQEFYESLSIPVPPLNIQQKIVSEIEVLEEKEEETKEEVEILKKSINTIFNSNKGNSLKRFDEVCELKAGDFVKVGDISKTKMENLYPCFGGNGLRGYVKTFTHDGKFSLVGRQGALCGNVHLVEGKFHATEHALVANLNSDIDTDWFYYKLVSMELNQYATGTAQPGLSVMNLKPIEIFIPSITEQQKIVAEIKKIEAQIADLEEITARIPEEKEVILKRYL
ncbi:restriction endonuclease subunit S [Lacihabitans sp. CCS-44]|nr:restriction endonuclease subunit S [Lacihabitans sp. CCS-44]